MRLEMYVIRGALMIAMAAVTTGCAGLLQPRLAGPSGPVELAAGHRVVFTDSGHRGIHIFEGPANLNQYRVCLEPSPDTGAGMSEDFGLGAFNTTSRSDRGRYGGVEVGAGGQALSLESGRSNETVIRRDLAVNLFRDTLSQACIAHAQGIISPQEYANFLRAATGGALSIAAMNAIRDRAGSTVHDENIAEKISSLAQMALFALMVTDDREQTSASEIIRRIAEIKTEAIEVEVEAARSQLIPPAAQPQR